MKTKLLLAVFFFSHLLILGQSDRKIIFQDDFDDSSKGWYAANKEEVWFQIKDSHYSLEHKRTSSGWLTHMPLKDFDSNANWSIETKIRHVAGVNTYGYGILFGRKENRHQTEFRISQNGYYMIPYFNGEYITLNSTKKGDEWTYSSHIRKGDYIYNTLKVEQIGTQWMFYINDKLVETTKAYTWAGNRIGFVVYNAQTIEVDYISISQILNGYVSSNGTGSSDSPSLTIYEPQLQRGLKSVNAKKLRVSGMATDSDGILNVKVNGQTAKIMKNGYFSTIVPLEPGRNTITIVTKDWSGETTVKDFQLESLVKKVVLSHK